MTRKPIRPKKCQRCKGTGALAFGPTIVVCPKCKGNGTGRDFIAIRDVVLPEESK